MNVIDRPTWQLVLEAAESLSNKIGDFRLNELVKEVQQIDPNRGWTSIQPIVQGMTSNAGTGPPSPCGKPLVRISHGLYRLNGELQEVHSRTRRAAIKPRSARVPSTSQRGKGEVERRVAGLINDFAACVESYDERVPFKKTGQYSLHRETIDMRRSHTNVHSALKDEVFIDHFRRTLYAWGIGKRGSRLVPLAEFGQRLRDCSDEIASFENLRLDDPELDVTSVAKDLWQLIEHLGVVENKSLIVPGSKTLHHLLPDLVPPMDRAWTGAFFLWSMGSTEYEQRTFVKTLTSFAAIAQATNPSSYVGDEWRTSLTKILDNSVIGYCKLHGIQARGS